MSPSDMHPSETLAYVWLVAFALAATLALLGVACQALRFGRVTRTTWAIWTALSWLLVALCLSAICERLNGWLTDSLALITGACLIALVPLLCYGRLAMRRPKSPVGPRLSWALVAANACVAVWAS